VREAQRGLTLLEVLVAVFLFTVVIGGVTVMLGALLRNAEAANETERAATAIGSKLEALRGHFPYGGAVDSLYARYAGERFAVTGLARSDGVLPGEVTFLSEADSLDAAHLPGVFLDVDGDGVTAEALTQDEIRAAVAAGRSCVARVQVTWDGREGRRTLSVAAVLFESGTE
jgi:prepilin-type N-terminal cleavage/methylation domain-containing protein